MKLLTIHQPWAWLIVHGMKDIENRDWFTHWTGRLGIHAGKSRASLASGIQFARNLQIDVPESELVFGALIGTVDLVACVTKSKSPWWNKGSQHGFVLSNPKLLREPIPMGGKIGFFPLPPGIVVDEGR